MGKYEKAKYLIRREARIPHVCHRCGREIKRDEEYFGETLGLIDKGPHLTFHSYCLECGPLCGIAIGD